MPTSGRNGEKAVRINKSMRICRAKACSNVRTIKKESLNLSVLQLLYLAQFESMRCTKLSPFVILSEAKDLRF